MKANGQQSKSKSEHSMKINPIDTLYIISSSVISPSASGGKCLSKSPEPPPTRRPCADGGPDATTLLLLFTFSLWVTGTRGMRPTRVIVVARDTFLPSAAGTERYKLSS